MRNRSRWLLLAGVFAAVLIVGLGGILVLRSLVSGSGFGREALQKHPDATDAVEALIAVVDDPSADLQERTDAVWALGQMRDPRALPVLKKYYTGEPCDHEKAICQYELSKAIGKIEGTYQGGFLGSLGGR